VKGKRLDAQDSMLAWMRQVSSHIQQGNRKGRLDLLNSTIETNLAGELTVRTMDEIPENLPVGSPVFVLDTGQVHIQNAETMVWEPTP